MRVMALKSNLISLLLIISSIISNFLSFAQPYEGIGVGTNYKVNVPANGGYYFHGVTDTATLYNHYVYVKENESVQFNYVKVANGSPNNVPGKYYIYSPIGLETVSF